MRHIRDAPEDRKFGPALRARRRCRLAGMWQKRRTLQSSTRPRRTWHPQRGRKNARTYRPSHLLATPDNFRDDRLTVPPTPVRMAPSGCRLCDRASGACENCLPVTLRVSMSESSVNSLSGKLPSVVRTAADVAQLVREQRRASSLRQIDLAGIGNSGNRLIVDIEKGKPTVQLQTVLDLPGPELVARQKTSRSLQGRGRLLWMFFMAPRSSARSMAHRLWPLNTRQPG